MMGADAVAEIPLPFCWLHLRSVLRLMMGVPARRRHQVATLHGGDAALVREAAQINSSLMALKSCMRARAAVSRSCACIGSPCLRHCVHGASIGGGGGGARARLSRVQADDAAQGLLHAAHGPPCLMMRRARPLPATIGQSAVVVDPTATAGGDGPPSPFVVCK
jgi:hypothetical protein